MPSIKKICLMSGLLSALDHYNHASIEKRKQREFALHMVCLNGVMLNMVLKDYKPDAMFYVDWLERIWLKLIKGLVDQQTIETVGVHCQEEILEILLSLDDGLFKKKLLQQQHPIAQMLTCDNFNLVWRSVLKDKQANNVLAVDVPSSLVEGILSQSPVRMDQEVISPVIESSSSPTSLSDDLESVNLSEHPHEVLAEVTSTYTSYEEYDPGGCWGGGFFSSSKKTKSHNEPLVDQPRQFTLSE